jgi:hypothetical protein
MKNSNKQTSDAAGRYSRDQLTQVAEPWCWVAEVWIDAHGNETTAHAPGSVAIFAISVNESYPANVEMRLKLLRELAARFGGRVGDGERSLWVFPGGFFGFDAAAGRWLGFDFEALIESLPQALRYFPAESCFALGADHFDGKQTAIVCDISASGLQITEIVRGETSLQRRMIRVGDLNAAIFVCGEGTGSSTRANGPFFERQLLSDPVAQLSGCGLLVDLAHSRIKGSVVKSPTKRQVHELQLRRFTTVGAAVLVHHHPGAVTEGRPKNTSQSNFVFLRGGQRLTEVCVTAVP